MPDTCTEEAARDLREEYGDDIPTVLIVHMQPNCKASNNDALLAVQQEEIRIAHLNGWPVAVLELENCEPTHAELLIQLALLNVRHVVEVSDEDASEAILKICRENGFGTKLFRVLGVNITACVLRTVRGLVNALDVTDIHVIKEGCADEAPYSDMWVPYMIPGVSVINQNPAAS